MESIISPAKEVTPVIFFNRVFQEQRCTSIVTDNLKAGNECTRHLIEQGCHRYPQPGWVPGPLAGDQMALDLTAAEHLKNLEQQRT